MRSPSAQHGQRLVGHVQHQRVRRVGAEVRRGLAQPRGEVDEAEVEGELAGLEPRRLERAVHEPGHARGGAHDRPRARAPLLERASASAVEQLRPAQDRGERRAEVVGHDVDELALRAVELHEPRVRVLERLVELGVAQQDADPVGERLAA